MPSSEVMGILCRLGMGIRGRMAAATPFDFMPGRCVEVRLGFEIGWVPAP